MKTNTNIDLTVFQNAAKIPDASKIRSQNAAKIPDASEIRSQDAAKIPYASEMHSQNTVKIPYASEILDAVKKQQILQLFGIDVDSDLFDLRLDYVAKRVLTHESPESKKALIGFLNASLVPVGLVPIIDLTIISPELTVDSVTHKKARFDIRARLQNGEQIIIEIEFSKKDNFKKRSQFIISKAYSSQDISGKSYSDLKRCYLVCVVDFTLFDEDDAYMRDGMFRDAKGSPITDDQTIVFLELTKVAGLLKKPVDELTDLECWLIFFKYATDKTKRDILNKILEREVSVMAAAQILETISKDEKERAIYEAQWLYEMDLSNDRVSALREGARQIAKNLKNINIPLDAISKSTGIPMHELIKL